MSDLPILYYAKLRNAQIVTYPSFELFQTSRGHHENSRKNLENPKPKGQISKKASKRMNEVIEVWTNAIQATMKKAGKPRKLIWQHITFVTLTLSSTQFHDDKYIKRHMLNRFLIEIQKNHGVKNYLWKAEKQKNGNIHFHILIDKYIHWRAVRNRWNRIQNDNGYMEPFTKKFGHNDPNSTDIHSLSKIENITAYMGKYMSKTEPDKPDLSIEGRVWGMSDSLRQCQSFTFFVDDIYLEFCKALKVAKKVEYFESEYFQVFRGDWKRVLKKEFPQIVEAIEAHFIEQMQIISNPPPPPPEIIHKSPEKLPVFKQLSLEFPKFYQSV